MPCPAENCFVELSLQCTVLFESCFIQLQNLTGAQLQKVKSDQGGIAGL